MDSEVGSDPWLREDVCVFEVGPCGLVVECSHLLGVSDQGADVLIESFGQAPSESYKGLGLR